MGRKRGPAQRRPQCAQRPRCGQELWVLLLLKRLGAPHREQEVRSSRCQPSLPLVLLAPLVLWPASPSVPSPSCLRQEASLALAGGTFWPSSPSCPSYWALGTPCDPCPTGWTAPTGQMRTRRPRTVPG